MESASARRVLIVANRTVATPTLLDHVKALAEEQPSEFALLIPDSPGSHDTDWTTELAVRLLSRATGSSVEALESGGDPYESVRRAVDNGHYDAIVVSTLPRRISRWLRRDLPHRVEALGVPVTVVTHESAEQLAKA